MMAHAIAGVAQKGMKPHCPTSASNTVSQALRNWPCHNSIESIGGGDLEPGRSKCEVVPVEQETRLVQVCTGWKETDLHAIP